METLVILIFPGHAPESTRAWIVANDRCTFTVWQSCSTFWRPVCWWKTTWVGKRKHYWRKSTSYLLTCFYFLLRDLGQVTFWTIISLFLTLAQWKLQEQLFWVKIIYVKYRYMTVIKYIVTMWSLNSRKLLPTWGKKITNLLKVF